MQISYHLCGFSLRRKNLSLRELSELLLAPRSSLCSAQGGLKLNPRFAGPIAGLDPTIHHECTASFSYLHGASNCEIGRVTLPFFKNLDVYLFIAHWQASPSRLLVCCALTIHGTKPILNQFNSPASYPLHDDYLHVAIDKSRSHSHYISLQLTELLQLRDGRPW